VFGERVSEPLASGGAIIASRNRGDRDAALVQRRMATGIAPSALMRAMPHESPNYVGWIGVWKLPSGENGICAAGCGAFEIHREVDNWALTTAYIGEACATTCP
jgi:hypothetical protein